MSWVLFLQIVALLFLASILIDVNTSRFQEKRQKDSGERLTHSEQTLFSVYDALEKSGLPREMAQDAINRMLNSGILFRERVRDDKEH